MMGIALLHASYVLIPLIRNIVAILGLLVGSMGAPRRRPALLEYSDAIEVNDHGRVLEV
jgi:hypothetical protein